MASEQMSSKKPKPQAAPTLAGLAVTWPDSERCLYPWSQVQVQSDKAGSSCWLYEPDGTRLRRNGRIPILRLPDQHVAKLCRLAQQRYIRCAWRDGTLKVVHQYKDSRVEALVCGFFCLAPVILFSLMLPRILAVLHRDSQLPGHIWLFTLPLFVALSLLLLVAPLYLALLLLVPNLLGPAVRRAVWTRRGIEAELTNGYTQSAVWSDFERLKRFGLDMMISFRPSTRLRFTGMPVCAMTLIREIQHELRPELEASEEAKSRIGLKRAAIWWALGSVVLAVAAGILRGAQIGVSAGVGMLAILGVAWVEIVWFEKWLKRRWHRRHRKASALQSNS